MDVIQSSFNQLCFGKQFEYLFGQTPKQNLHICEQKFYALRLTKTKLIHRRFRCALLENSFWGCCCCDEYRAPTLKLGARPGLRVRT